MLKISKELIADDIFHEQLLTSLGDAVAQTQWVAVEGELDESLYDDVTYRDEEKKARALFKSLQPNVYAECEASGFARIRTESSIFPIQYTIACNSIYVFGTTDWLCVAPK